MHLLAVLAGCAVDPVAPLPPPPADGTDLRIPYPDTTEQPGEAADATESNVAADATTTAAE